MCGLLNTFYHISRISTGGRKLLERRILELAGSDLKPPGLGNIQVFLRPNVSWRQSSFI